MADTPRIDAGWESSLPRPPIFVGGTGRSGTSVTGKLLGSHSDYHMFEIEVRFISDSGGLCDLAEGRTTFAGFKRRVLNRWYDRGARRGLHLLVDRATVEASLHMLWRDLKVDRWAAARAFAHRLLDPVAAAHGALGWVEMTPTNVRSPAALLRVFPAARLVHSVRDGRDVACSVAPLNWGPADVDEALDWWAEHLGSAFAASAALPPERVHVVRMESLTVERREQEYRRLIEFVGLEEDPAMRAFFETSMTPQRAHVGRWRDEVPADHLEAFDAHYQRLARRLVDDGYPYVIDSPAEALTREA